LRDMARGLMVPLVSASPKAKEEGVTPLVDGKERANEEGSPNLSGCTQGEGVGRGYRGGINSKTEGNGSESATLNRVKSNQQKDRA